MKKANKIFIWMSAILTIFFFFMVGIWTIDISVSGIASPALNIVCIGLYGERGLWVSYHIGLVMCTISIILMSLMVIYLVSERGN